MSALLVFLAMTFLPAIAVGEFILYWVRRRKGRRLAYVHLSALVRGGVYTPAFVGIGHGGIVLPIVLGLAMSCFPEKLDDPFAVQNVFTFGVVFAIAWVSTYLAYRKRNRSLRAEAAPI